MKNFKNFELNNKQQSNTFGQGRPDNVDLPDQAGDASAPDFVADLPDAASDNADTPGDPSFTGNA